jgi:peptidoglycan/xylan/chitin deacetylase (PgdA/CDA1 family)
MVGGRLNRSGELRDAAAVHHLSFRRPGESSFVATFPFRKAGLRVGHFAWRVRSGWGDPSCEPEPDPDLGGLPLPLRVRRAVRRERQASASERESLPCFDRAPNRGYYGSKVKRPRIVGCTRDEDLYNTNGPRSRKRIALTFDDGPSAYTGRVIDILNRRNVDATFFVLGANIPGRTQLLRRMLSSGHEIGNHSLHHEKAASAASLRETNSLIHGATGFMPCLYRPPGGYRSADTAAAAWRMGMSNIIWDVDPQDWGRPGSGAIYSRSVSAARSGSIVLLHDGGGDRSQTVAALDDIIANFKGRGYRLVTVTRLLNERFRWRP